MFLLQPDLSAGVIERKMKGGKLLEEKKTLQKKTIICRLREQPKFC